MKEINYNKIDMECRELVKFFNENGLPTNLSCQGHDNFNNYFISFDDTVTDNDIANFLLKYSNKYNHSPFVGKFVKWARKISGEIKMNWRYTIATKNNQLDYTFAKKDLETMKNIL